MRVLLIVLLVLVPLMDGTVQPEDIQPEVQVAQLVQPARVVEKAEKPNYRQDTNTTYCMKAFPTFCTRGP